MAFRAHCTAVRLRPDESEIKASASSDVAMVDTISEDLQTFVLV